MFSKCAANLWVKDNAYVAGLSEDLNFHGNQLVDLQTIGTFAQIGGQIPFLYLLARVPMNWLIPGTEILYHVFTLLQFRATSFAELMAYRFFVGFFEVYIYIYIYMTLASCLLMT